MAHSLEKENCTDQASPDTSEEPQANNSRVDTSEEPPANNSAARQADIRTPLPATCQAEHHLEDCSPAQVNNTACLHYTSMAAPQATMPALNLERLLRTPLLKRTALIKLTDSRMWQAITEVTRKILCGHATTQRVTADTALPRLLTDSSRAKTNQTPEVWKHMVFATIQPTSVPETSKHSKRLKLSMTEMS